MKNRFFSFFLLILLLSAQDKSSFDTQIDIAFQNAKKGIYFALSNIPESKSSLSKDLIEGDTLIASIKLTKEIAGIKVESTGYYRTYEISITLYRSYDLLEKEGFR